MCDVPSGLLTGEGAIGIEAVAAAVDNIDSDHGINSIVAGISRVFDDDKAQGYNQSQQQREALLENSHGRHSLIIGKTGRMSKLLYFLMAAPSLSDFAGEITKIYWYQLIR
jgi:hypothetical protein